MTLRKYFMVSKQSGDNGTSESISYLPDTNGPRASKMLSSAIAAANSSVTRMTEIRQRKQETGKPHSAY